MNNKIIKSFLKRHKSLALVLLILIIVFLFIKLNPRFNSVPTKQKEIEQVSTLLVPKPTPTVFQNFNQPKIPLKSEYRIALLGDSMTTALGPHGGLFSEYLNKEYKEHANAGIIVDNYAGASTNIQSLQKRFNEPLTIDGTLYPPLKKRKDLDLIILESFAYNPLSHLSQVDSELEHHRQLRLFLENVSKELPNTRVVLMATIAPNSKNYARRVLKISQDERSLQVAERTRYLIRQIELAGYYAIPVINVYAKSLTPGGDGDLRYINSSDYIHPSFAGIELIARTMTEFISNQKILPSATVPY